MKQGIYILLSLLIMHSTLELDAQETPEQNFTLAVEFNKKGEYQSSIHFCNKALEINNELTNVLFLRGYNFYQIEKYDQAIQDFTRALELDPEYLEAYFYRAKSRQASHKYFGALSDFNKARELNPAQATVFVFKGVFTSLFGGKNE